MLLYPLTKQKAVRSVLFLLGGCLIGLASVRIPAVSFLLVLALTVLFVCIRYPQTAGAMAVFTFSLSVQKLANVSIAGLDTESFYKMGLLLLAVPFVIRYGFKRELSFPILALIYILVQTFLFSSLPDNVSVLDPFKAFFGLAVPFVFLLVNWSPETSRRHVYIIMLLPIFSVIAGFLLQMAHIDTLYSVEYFSQVARLQGANIPAHLAMLAYFGVAIPIMELNKQPKQKWPLYALAIINFAILIGTGSRGPLLALVPIFAVYMLDQIKTFLKGKMLILFPMLAFIAVIGFIVAEKWGAYQARQENQGLSGRDSAWQYFLDKANHFPFFGQGLGSALAANDGSLYQGFIVPHNEFLRFYYDGGIIGWTVMWLAILLVFRRIYSVLQRGQRMYFSAFIVAFLIYSFTDNTMSTIQFTAPFCCYLNAAYLIAQSDQSTKKEGMLPWARERRSF